MEKISQKNLMRSLYIRDENWDTFKEVCSTKGMKMSYVVDKLIEKFNYETMEGGNDEYKL